MIRTDPLSSHAVLTAFRESSTTDAKGFMALWRGLRLTIPKLNRPYYG